MKVTPDRWRQIRKVLDAALEVSPDERPAWLATRCGEDTELRAEVESLLASHEEAGDLLETNAVGHGAAAVMSALDKIEAGRRIGSYMVLEEIGRGGMGAVYRGIRADDHFRRQVAIKVVKRGMDTDFIVRRFQNERQILANLDHPNIAKLYDGGTTDDGLPYFVMEYIPGKPLDEYCDSEKLSIADRLQLFRQVCSAVQCAHESNVVHRDLKPSNVLVTTDGTPKLLDFGIAKVLQDESAGHTADSTATAFQIMTPEYASPEQVKAERVTPLSDVYSLGVVLYRLLTGHGPYRLRTRTPQSMAWAIVEAEPSLPSDVVNLTEPIIGRDGELKATVTPDSVAAARDGDPKRLRKQLCGDLDNIVLKAMSKDPAARYSSAAALADDIGRYLEGMPVIARRPTFSYRSSKWVRRNPVWAFVGVLAVLAGITGLLTWQGLMPRVRIVNGTKFRPAVAVLGFRNLNGRADTSWLSATFAELFTTELGAGGRTRMIPPDDIESLKKELGIAPGEGLSRAALARIRERAGSCMLLTGSYLIVGDGPNSPLRLDLRLIDAETGEVITALNESGPQKDLLGIVARAGMHLRGKFANAALTEADETQMRASQPASAEAARLFAEGLTAFRNYQTIEARDLLEKAVKADPRHAMSYAALAGTLSSLGYDAKAREAAKKAFDLSPNLSREDALFIEGRYREITRSWKRAAEIYKTLWGFFPDNLEYGLRLASVQIPAGSPTEALSTVEALRRYPKPMSDDPRIDLNEAEAALALQEYKRADQAASIALRKGEAHNSRILVARADLASARALSGLGDGARAIQRISDAQRIYQQLGHRRGVSLALSELANALDEQGDLNGARKAYEDSLQVCREIGNKSGEATALNNLGVLFHKEGDFGRAISYHKETLELRRALEDKSGEALAIGNIANALFEQGDLAGAKENYERSLALYRQAGLQRSIARILTSLGMTVREMGDLATAKDLVEQSLAIRREAGDTLGETRAQYYRAIVLHDNGDLREARQLFEEALASRRKQGDKEWIARTLEGMGLLAISSNDLPQARNYLEEALALRIGTNDRNGVARSRLALAYLSLAEKRSQTAEEMAHDAMTEFEREKATVGQAECLLVIARAMKAERKVGDAARNLDRAESLASSAGAGRIRQLVAHARSGLKY